MDEYIFLRLLDKYVSGSANESERLLVEEYYNKLSSGEKSQVLSSEMEEVLKESMLRNIRERIHRPAIIERSRSWHFTFIRAAAAILIAAMSVSLYLYLSESRKVNDAQEIAQNDIAPGGNRAVLTLADGKRIDLQDVERGQIIEVRGVKIIKTAEGQLIYRTTGDGVNGEKGSLNTISTPRGGQYQVILPDETKVWLNAASSITYPTVFSGNERSVEITGEAYFEVAHDKSKPFYVKSATQEVEVLGTHFNVSTYADELSANTTLLEGSIRIYTNSKQERVLRPNQQAVLKNDMLVVSSVNPEEAIAWKNGRFIFNNTDIQVVMRMISRWYDVEIEYEKGVPQKTFVGDVSRFENISQLLEVLEATGNVHFEREGRRITVM